ncbi:hypothetical protein IFM5058_09000 [Aspergillus udagawae]|nr:hypothetical protein IFM5058_09000 [Aspergillus udagawae]
MQVPVGFSGVVKLICFVYGQMAGRNALDIEPEPVELQIYTGDVSTNGTQTFDVAGMIGPGDDEVVRSLAPGFPVCRRLPHCH